MTARCILDLRVGAVWSAHSRDTFQRAAAAAWADPVHPSSEGRRSAVWLEATRATVRELTGYPHVVFFASRDQAALTLMEALDRPWTTAETNRQTLLRRVPRPLRVDWDGQTQPGQVEQGTGGPVVLLQAGNEETGVIDAAVDAITVLDATTTFARAPLPFDADLLLIDARAWGSPVDLAMALSRHPLPLQDSVQVAAVVVAVEQLTRVLPGMLARTRAEAQAMAQFEQALASRLPDVQFHGAERVPHIRSFSILHLDAETLTRALDEQGYGVGSGSACVLDGRPSHVLAAMGRVTHGNLRLALPWDLDLAVLAGFADVVVQTARRLREEAGVADL